jgi:hypothetical protein
MSITRTVAQAAAALLLPVGLTTAVSSPADAYTPSPETCEDLGYTTKVKTQKLRSQSGRSYGHIRTLSKPGSPRLWCTYVLKAKKYRTAKHSVKLEVSTWVPDRGLYSPSRTSGRSQKRSAALTYVAVRRQPGKRERVHVSASFRDGKTWVYDSYSIR